MGGQQKLGRWGNLASSAGIGGPPNDEDNEDALMTVDLPSSPLVELSNVSIVRTGKALCSDLR